MRAQGPRMGGELRGACKETARTREMRTSGQWWHGERREVPLTAARPKTLHCDYLVPRYVIVE